MYLKWGFIKHVRRKILGNICKFILMTKPVWRDIVDYKSKVKNYSNFDKKYIDYCKYLSIYHTIRKLKPKFVLECGSGISTAIIAKALEENGMGKLISMDEYEKFGSVVSKIVGSSVEMHISETVEDVYQGMPGTRYKNLPNYFYDIVFVDGPVTKTIDLDAFYVLEKHPYAKVLIDCRVATINALRTKYKGGYNPFTNMGRINF